MGNLQVMPVKKCQWSHNLMKRGGTYGKWLRPILKKCINGTRILWTSPDEGWILSHKLLGPYVSPFKVLEKKFPDTYKFELPENPKVHSIFHVSLLKPTYDASRPNQEHNSRPPHDLIDNEPKFEMEVVLKSRQLKGREQEYLVKWTGYHLIKTSWVNESDMEHAQKTKEEFHNGLAKKQKKHRIWWRHHLFFSGAGNYINVPQQVVSEIKVKDFQEIASWT